MPTANSPPSSVADLYLFSLFSRGTSCSYWQGLSWFSSCTPLQCHYFLPLPIPHLEFGELHSSLQMFYIFCCLRAFTYVSSARNSPSFTSLCQDNPYSDFSKLRPSFLPNQKWVVTPTICYTVSFFFFCLSHNILLYCTDRYNCWFPPLVLRLYMATLYPENMEPVIEWMINKYFLMSKRWTFLCYAFSSTLLSQNFY